MLEDGKDPYIHRSWYDRLKLEGLYGYGYGYDYTKKRKLTNNTSE